MRIISQIINFIKNDIWRIPLNELSPLRSFLVRQLRIFLLAIKGFTEDKIQLRSSALTLYSLLSIVPVLAVAFGIAKGFGFKERLQQQLEGFLSADNQQEVLNKVIEFSNNMLDNTKGGLIAGIGLVILFWSVIKVLNHIESAFNQIWQIKSPRTWFRKFSDYLSFILIAPILMIVSSGVNVFMRNLADDTGFFAVVSPLLLKMLPFVIIWLMFTFIYMMMPNTRVRFKSALTAGIIAGTAFQLLQVGYVLFQGLLSRYSVIYGTFAALPLFLIWMQMSWLIVLFGAEISFANQNIEKYEIESESLHISHFYREILTLYVAHLVIKRFVKGEIPLKATEIAHHLKMPIRIIRDMIYDLTESGVFSQIATDSEREWAFQPAVDVNQLSIASVLEMIDKKGRDEIDISRTKELKKLSEVQTEFKEIIKNSQANKLLKDI